MPAPPLSASAAAVLIASALTVPSAGRAAAPGLMFLNARLGMSLAEWRTVPIPPGDGSDVVRTCNDRDRTLRIPGYPLSAREAASGVVACGYRARFGHRVLDYPVALAPNFNARDLAYVFRRGRLAEIRFRASVDAYDVLRRRLGLKGGARRPAAAGRGLARARAWRVEGARVRIGPGALPTELAVDIRRDDGR